MSKAVMATTTAQMFGLPRSLYRGAMALIHLPCMVALPPEDRLYQLGRQQALLRCEVPGMSKEDALLGSSYDGHL